MQALVIEDSTTVRKILCDYLRQLDIHAVEAANGHQGLERLKEMTQLDLVLVDWDMPVMSGIEFIRAVRNLSVYDPLPLIMVTTRSQKDYSEAASVAGANQFIEKPCTLDALRSKLDLLGLTKR
jgi:two-component system chemotaxis response regulator CheY